MTNDKLADEIETLLRKRDMEQLAATVLYHESDILAALRRQPGPPCEDCGFGLVKGELDRSGQEWWCPICAKAGMRMAENKRLRADLAQAQARCAELGQALTYIAGHVSLEPEHQVRQLARDAIKEPR